MADGNPVLWYGTGRFLQAHADLFVSEAAAVGEALGGTMVAQSTASAASSARTNAPAREQGFEVWIRGIRRGCEIDERRVCRAVREALDARSGRGPVRGCIRGPGRVVVSNAGDTGGALDAQNDARLNPVLRHRLTDIAQHHAQQKARRIQPLADLTAQRLPGLARIRLRAVPAEAR